MNWVFIVLLMIFCHIVDDYYLQRGLLASLKQKSYWQENAPDKMYRHDYIWALLMHSFSWSFMVMLPIAVFDMHCNLDALFGVWLIFNMVTHAVTDTLKANLKLINLWQDQLIHLVQIALTAVVFFIHQG